jgi:hypothetical protein
MPVKFMNSYIVLQATCFPRPQIEKFGMGFEVFTAENIWLVMINMETLLKLVRYVPQGLRDFEVCFSNSNFTCFPGDKTCGCKFHFIPPDVPKEQSSRGVTLSSSSGLFPRCKL